MLPFFPKTVANKGLLIYIVCVIVVSSAFFSFAMELVWVMLGVVEVSLFFMCSNVVTKRWRDFPRRIFIRELFWFSLLVRIVWVLFSYFFYQYKTGVPFEYGAADSIGYHGAAEWLSLSQWKTIWDFLFLSRSGVSDSGYCLYLTLLYKLIGPNVIIARLLKAIYGSIICVLIYKLTTGYSNEQVGRIAAVFSMLMPNLIIYCGLHLKETEMLLLIVLFLERADHVLRSKRYNFLSIIIPIVIAGVLFLFRTVIGVVALFSFVTALIFSPKTIINKGRKVVLAMWVVIGISVLAGGVVMNEVEVLWMNRNTNQESRRLEQTIRGNQWAKYATGTVMAPMVFVLPFSTMVDTDQENQMMMHGGNYVRNFMGVFAVIALWSILFVKKNWREFSLIGSFFIGYLGIISMSGFANSERFLLPGLPGLIVFWAYGISLLNAKNYRFVRLWYYVVPIMEIGWAFFKVGSRGWL